jgi:succinate dehydrogenase hydrophobic anchor subunit
LPLTDAPQGEWLFYGSLSLFPLYWLARWLLRTTSPKQDSPVRMRLSALIILAIACMLMLQAIFLIWAILSGNDFGSFRELFGSDWFASLLQVTLGTAVIFAIGAVPYALLGLFRGTGHRGAMLGILLCTSVALACAFGALAVIAMLSIG